MFEEASYRAIQSYKLLCMFKDNNGDSVCESGDESNLENIIKNVFIDKPSNNPYNFDYNPPNVYGQIGVPEVVDRILGK